MRKITILLAFMAFLGMQVAHAQERTVTGKITSAEDGSSLPGVTVVVKGTTLGVISDIDGMYKLDVPADANTLVFSFVGMKTEERTLGTSDVINVAMSTDFVGLDEVVVTAMGIKRETKALGYAVQAVSGEELGRTGEVNVIQSLSSKAAGVQVIGSGGTPGSSSKILIRGNSSFTGNNQPLIVIDGVPVDNATQGTSGRDNPYNSNLEGVNNSNRALDINPDDIESVTILKGPAAAALYGVRAGAGAIVYTTKRGVSGDRVKVTYGFNMDIATINKTPDLQDTYAQGDYDDFGNPEYNVADYGPDNLFNTDDDVSWGTSNSWGPKLSELGLSPVDNIDKFFENATTMTHNLSITGGNENTSFRLSLNRLDQDGIVPHTDFAKTSIRLTADHNLSKKIRVGGTVNYIKSGGTKAQNGSNLSGVMLGLLRTPASFDLLNPDGSYKFPTGQQRQYFYPYDNPYWTVNENPFKDEIDRVLGNIFFNYKPLSWLDVTYKIGVDFYDDVRKQVFAIGSWASTAQAGGIFDNPQRRREIYSDLLFTATHQFSDKITGKITVGNNLSSRYWQDVFARGEYLAIPDFYNLSNASDLYASTYEETIRTAALFFDASFDYNRLIYLGVTGRNEWSSTFGPNQNNFFYPSASASFVFSELFPENEVLSFGKLRYAYAQAGISPEAYTSNTYFTGPSFADGFTAGLSFPYQGHSGFGYSSILGNDALEPELVTGNEVGLDVRFLNGRVSLDLTYYNQKTTNALVYRPLAGSSGFTSRVSNTGEMVNKGIEMVLSGTPVKTKDFNWDVTLNFTTNESEVLTLAPGVDEVDIEAAFTSIGSYAIVGEAYGVFYGTKWKRDDNGNLVINSQGLPIIEDLRGNIGNPFPDWLLGFRNTFNYKGLSASILFDIREGGDIWNGTLGRLHRLGRSAESVNRDQNYIIPGVLADADGNPTTTENNIEIDGQTYFQQYLGDGGGAAEQFIEDGSWIRLREVSFSYHLDTKDKLPLAQYVDFSLSARNLWIDSDYSGVDPETSLTGAGSNLTGFDYFNMPGTRSVSFGVKIGF